MSNELYGPFFTSSTTVDTSSINQSTLFAPVAIYSCMYTLHLSIVMEQELSTNPYGLYKESTCYKITVLLSFDNGGYASN